MQALASIGHGAKYLPTKEGSIFSSLSPYSEVVVIPNYLSLST